MTVVTVVKVVTVVTVVKVVTVVTKKCRQYFFLLLKFGQKSKDRIGTKLANSNCEKNQKLKL